MCQIEVKSHGIGQIDLLYPDINSLEETAGERKLGKHLRQKMSMHAISRYLMK